MANSRIISTSFWRDNYVMELDPSEKLLFLYFLTNPNTTIAGVYEINLRTVAFETGFDIDMVKKILQRFCDDEKMWFKDGWLVLRNFIKHQRLNPSVEKGIKRAISELPSWLRDEIKILQKNSQLTLELTENEPVDKHSLSTDSTQTALPNLTKPNLTKPNANAAGDFKKSRTLNPKVYAQAVQADNALRVKETEARDRSGGSGIELARAAAEKLKRKVKS